MSSKIIPIKYTSRDYETIRRDLIEHAKRYYPDTFKDFNEGSFGSLMVDTVSYIGDILSFYLDYQANECFLDTASEFNNVLKIAKILGYKLDRGSTSTGIASFYIEVPANSNGLGPDLRYAPILKSGSSFSTNDGTKFILTQDVRFDLPSNDTRPGKINPDTSKKTFIIKAYGAVVSGIINTETVSVGDYQKYLKLKLSGKNIVEILTVFDTEGNEYYEVQNLAQNIIYKSITNKDPNTYKIAKEILKPYLVPRRFTVENEIDATYLQFGASSVIQTEDSDSYITEPGRVVLNMYGKDYISDTSFDPTRLLTTDKLGVAPSNTNLFVTYRQVPTSTNINFSANSLVNIQEANFIFLDEQNLYTPALQNIKSSLEINNEAPILGEISTISSDDLKIRIKNSFSMQNRAVTAEDYKAMCYSMPSKYGAVKRVSVLRDENSFRRNINLYMLCEDENGFLTKANQIVKQNLKTWLLKGKMLNDSIDILDGKIINYGIEFVATGHTNRPKYDILTDAVNQLKKDFSLLPDFGETFFITNILASLKKVEGILDVVNIKLVPKNGGKYSNTFFNIDEALSADKRYLNVPVNAVMEIKYPNSDIKGTIL